MDSEIIIKKNKTRTVYDLKHILNLTISVDEFKFENGMIKPALVNVKSTNHVYTRAIKDSDNKKELDTTGELITRYEYEPNDIDIIKKDKEGKLIKSKELRVFCVKKYEQSFFLKPFIDMLNSNISNACVLPHQGDDLKVMSGLFNLPEEYGDNYYIVFFKLHKMKASLIHMIIETAFIVTPDDFRYELFNRKDTKPLAILMRNIFAGRKPFEGKSVKRNKKAAKIKKKKEAIKKLNLR